MIVKKQKQTFLIWWRNNLSLVLPELVSFFVFGYPIARKAIFKTASEKIVSNRSGIELPMFLIEEGTSRSIPRSKKPRNKIVDIYLPIEKILVRKFELPLKASRELSSALKLNIAANTPFTCDQIYWSTQLSKENNRIICVQYIVKKTMVLGLVKALKAEGIQVRRMFVQERKTLPMADFGWELARNNSGSRKVNVLIGSLIVLCLVYLQISGQWEHNVQMDRLEGKRNELQEVAVAKRHQLNLLEQEDKQRLELIKWMEESSNFIKAISLITAEIPDSSWLTQLRYQDSSVIISGKSKSSASDLILAIENNPTFKNVELVGAITKDQRTNTESYKIQFDVVNLRR